MSDLYRHLLLCDPIPDSVAGTKGWKQAVQGVARIILDPQNSTPWEMAEILARITVEGRLGSDHFGAKAGLVIAKTLPDSSGRHGLFGCVCAMSAAIYVMENPRLSAEPKVSTRDSIAVALWSALSFQRPLAKQRLEDFRAEILNSARHAGLELARRMRNRRTQADGASLDEQNHGLRWNAALDLEEIEVLRWTLADESNVLNRPYADVGSHESFALARGLDLGLLLTRFPVFEHYELASRDVAAGHEIDLGGLVDAVGEDCNALVEPFKDDAVIETCPATFPLLTALRGGPTGRADGAVARSLSDWCGRALLESSIVRRSQTNGEEARWHRDAISRTVRSRRRADVFSIMNRRRVRTGSPRRRQRRPLRLSTLARRRFREAGPAR